MEIQLENNCAILINKLPDSFEVFRLYSFFEFKKAFYYSFCDEKMNGTKERICRRMIRRQILSKIRYDPRRLIRIAAAVPPARRTAKVIARMRTASE